MRWHDRWLTALGHTLLEVETKQFEGHVNLCGQIKAWAAGGYRTLPQETLEPSEEPGGQALTHELAELGCVGSLSPSEAVVSVLRRYRRAGEKPTKRQVELAESRSSAAIFNALSAAEEALDRALDAHFPPPKPGQTPKRKTKIKPPRPYRACNGPEEGIFPSIR